MIDVGHEWSLLVECLRDNYLSLNACECHLLVCGYEYLAIYASVGDVLLRKQKSVKLLGFIIDS